MEIGTLLTILALTLASAAFLAQPLLQASPAPAEEPDQKPGPEFSLRENTLRLDELEADLADHRIDHDGYQVQKEKLLEQRARIQEALQIRLQDPIETAVRDMRARLDAGTATEMLACPSCGEQVGAWKFCPACGKPLPDREIS